MLASRVATYIRDHAIVRPAEHVLVAVSGGPDSLALLSLLRELQPAFSLRLVVAHFDHRWRPESAGEARTVAALAERWGYPSIIGQAEAGVEHTENAARTARYAFLRKAAEATDSEVIATGHTLDDQVETLLLHLLRGAGSRGLAAMRPRAGDLARPLLGTTRTEIEAYLAERQLQPHRDPSNDDPRFARNRVRQLIIPALEAYHPQARRLLARAAEILTEEDDLIDGLSEQALAANAELQDDPDAFRALPLAIQRRVLHRLFPDIDFEHIEEMRRAPAVQPGIIDAEQPMPATGQSQTLAVRVCQCDPTTFHARDPVGHVDAMRVVPPLRITHRAPGDRVQPLGFAHEKKLQDVLVDAHIPRSLRDSLPIVRDASGIVWIPGVTIAENKRVTPSSREQLHLEIVTS